MPDKAATTAASWLQPLLRAWRVRCERRATLTALVLGDSHVRVFEHWWFAWALPRVRWHVVYAAGGTAAGMGNARSVTGARSRFNQALQDTPHAVVIVNLGEVDTGHNIWARAARDRVDPQKMMEQAVQRYTAFLDDIASRHRVIVVGAPLPTLPDGAAAGPDGAGMRPPVPQGMRERTRLTLAFNDAVAAACAARGIVHLDDRAHSLGADGCVRPAWQRRDRPDHHYARARYARWLARALEPHLPPPDPPASPHFCPAYPQPRKHKAAGLPMFLRARRSWLDALHERSYRMHMGEVHLPGLDLYMVNEPALVRRVLADEAAQFPKSPLLGEALAPLLGQSIFTTNGAQWRRQRDMMDPAFAHARVAVAFPMMLAATQALLARLEGLPDGAEHDMEVEMTHVTADIIFRTIFSVPLEGADARHIFEAFARYQAIAPRLMLPSLFGVRWLVWPWDRWRSRAAAQDIRGLLARLIRPRFEAQRAGRPAAHHDILQSLLEARDPASGSAFGTDELIDQVAMLFLAGHETSASALTWALHLLAHAPDVQARAHAEVMQQLGQRDPVPDDLKSLPLVRNVFRETLRLFPPVGFLARQAASACTMRKKAVPAGATVVVAPWLIQRHRAFWPDAPDAFNPDRHTDEGASESLRHAYLPFGMGPRVCLGAAFALQEATLILAGVLRRWSLVPVPGHVPQPVGRLTIRSANGVRLRLHRRGDEA